MKNKKTLINYSILFMSFLLLGLGFKSVLNQEVALVDNYVQHRTYLNSLPFFRSYVFSNEKEYTIEMEKKGFDYEYLDGKSPVDSTYLENSRYAAGELLNGSTKDTLVFLTAVSIFMIGLLKFTMLWHRPILDLISPFLWMALFAFSMNLHSRFESIKVSKADAMVPRCDEIYKKKESWIFAAVKKKEEAPPEIRMTFDLKSLSKFLDYYYMKYEYSK